MLIKRTSNDKNIKRGKERQNDKKSFFIKQSKNSSCNALPLKLVPIGRPDTSVINYQSTRRKGQKSEDLITNAAEA